MMKMFKIDDFSDGFLGGFSRKITKVDKIVKCWKCTKKVADQSNPYWYERESEEPHVGLLVRNFPALRPSNQSNPINN